MITLLFVIAVIIGITGLVRLIQGDILWGVILLIIALAVGPGGWSIWG